MSFGQNINASGGVTGVRRQADARARGLRRVQIEPHLSVTGATASEWIPIRPKTDHAFLFAMIHVLLHEHRVDELDVPFLSERTAAPYLIAPNGFFLRDPATRKPLVWDRRSGRAVSFDTPGAEPALLGRYTVSGVELGADDERWEHAGVTVATAHQALADHVRDFSPEWAASICDVPAARIRGVANEFLAQACIGRTCEVEGRVMPLRPVVILLGKSVNTGWGSYECMWARTLLQVLVGALEVPGGLLGTKSMIVGPENDRMASCMPGDDGFHGPPVQPDRQNGLAGEAAGAPRAYDADPAHRHRAVRPAARQQLAGVDAPAGPRCRDLGKDEPARRLDRLSLQSADLVLRDRPARRDDRRVSVPGVVRLHDRRDEPLRRHPAARLHRPRRASARTHRRHAGLRAGCYDSQGWVLRQPAVPPRGNSRDASWIGSELARRVGLLREFNEAVNAGFGVFPIPLKGAGYDFSLDVGHPHTPEGDLGCGVPRRKPRGHRWPRQRRARLLPRARLPG